MELMFREPETFEAPDLEGNMIKYIILPMQVENIPQLLKYIDLRTTKNKAKVKEDKSREKPKTKNKSKAVEDAELIEKNPLLDKEIGELAKYILDEGVRSIETNEPLPMYHRRPDIVMKLINKIIDMTNEGGKSSGPLPEEKSQEKKS